MSTDTTTTERPQRLRGPRRGPDGRDFPWGPIQQIHEVGDIQVVEYLRDMSNHSQREYWDEHGKTYFHAYVAGRDISMSFLSLDSALVGAITYKRRGPNNQSARMFDLMTLGEIPEDTQG